MNAAPSLSVILGVCAGLFLLVCFLCLMLLRRRSYLLLLLWPVVIYFYGPAATSLFADTPVLGRYVFPETVIPETLLMFAYVLGLYVCDRLFNISGAMKESLEGPGIARLARSPFFLPIFVPTIALAVGLQLVILRQFGSALNGGTYSSELAGEGYIPYWGFLAGLYEIVFLLVVLFLLSRQRSGMRLFVLGSYVLAAVLRLAGGTRLILIKEIAVILIIAYSQHRIRARHLGIAAVVVLLVGSAVGILRIGAGEVRYGYLGPLFGLVMESGLNALTLNIAYQVHAAGYIADHGQFLNSVGFILISIIPKFLRFGISADQLAALSPYNAALGYGFGSYAPAGAMSGFATVAYISNYPLAATLGIVAMIVCFAKLVPKGPMKSLVILTFSISAIHFWRDPVDIAFKDFVQDLALAAVLMYVPSIKKAVLTAEHGGPPEAVSHTGHSMIPTVK